MVWIKHTCPSSFVIDIHTCVRTIRKEIIIDYYNPIQSNPYGGNFDTGNTFTLSGRFLFVTFHRHGHSLFKMLLRYGYYKDRTVVQHTSSIFIFRCLSHLQWYVRRFASGCFSYFFFTKTHSTKEWYRTVPRRKNVRFPASVPFHRHIQRYKKYIHTYIHTYLSISNTCFSIVSFHPIQLFLSVILLLFHLSFVYVRTYGKYAQWNSRNRHSIHTSNLYLGLSGTYVRIWHRYSILICHFLKSKW